MNTSACKTYGNRRKLACLSLATESSKTGEPSYRLDSHTTGHSHDDDFSAGDDDAPNDRNDDEDWRTASDFPGGLDEETNGGDDIAAGFKGDEGDDDIFGLDGEEGTNEKVSSGGHTNAGEKVVTLVNSNPMVGETKMSTERLKEVTVAGEKFDTSDPDPKNIDDEEFKDTMRQPVTPRRRKAIVRRQEGAGGLQAGEVESWEECPKVVANEKKDYYEFVVSPFLSMRYSPSSLLIFIVSIQFCNIVLASISLAVLVQRHRKLAERQYGRLAARIGVTVFDGPAVASN